MSRLAILIFLLFWCNISYGYTHIIYDTTNLPTTGVTLFSGTTIFQPFCIKTPTVVQQIEIHAFVPNSPPAQLFLKVYDEDGKTERAFNHAKEKDTWLYLYDDVNLPLNPGRYFLGVYSNKRGLLWADTSDGQKAKIVGETIPVPEASSWAIALASIGVIILLKWWKPQNNNMTEL